MARLSEAQTLVIAKVSGLSPSKRKDRALVALQAFIDDSMDDHVLTLGGFIAPAERWVSFTGEWENALRMSPRIRYFKMSEAMGSSGEFSGISDERRNERIKILYRIAEEAALAFVGISIELKPYASMFGNLQVLKNPYYMAIFGIAGQLAAKASDIGINEKVSLIFDDRSECKQVRDAWDDFKRLSPASVQSLLGSNPAFEDDTEFLPLQAADMVAWWIRQKKLEQLGLSARVETPWVKTRDVPGLVFDWSEMSLLKSHAEILGIPLPMMLKLRDGFIPLPDLKLDDDGDGQPS